MISQKTGKCFALFKSPYDDQGTLHYVGPNDKELPSRHIVCGPLFKKGNMSIYTAHAEIEANIIENKKHGELSIHFTVNDIRDFVDLDFRMATEHDKVIKGLRNKTMKIQSYV